MQVMHSEFQEKQLGTSGTVTMDQHTSKQQQIVKQNYKSWQKHTHKVTPPTNLVQWYLGCYCTTKCFLPQTCCSNLRILMTNLVLLHTQTRMAPILCMTACFLHIVKQMPEFLWDIPIIQIDKTKSVTLAAAPPKEVYQRSGLHFQHFEIIWKFFNDLLV